jgi:hypothetical protein
VAGPELGLRSGGDGIEKEDFCRCSSGVWGFARPGVGARAGPSVVVVVVVVVGFRPGSGRRRMRDAISEYSGRDPLE